MSLVAVLLFLLLLSSFSTPSQSQQLAFQWVQSPVSGNASIFLNLWGSLGGCGAGTANQLYVQYASGTIMGTLVIFPQNDTHTTASPSNCLNLSPPYLDASGLGFFGSPIPIVLAYWQLYAVPGNSTAPYALATNYSSPGGSVIPMQAPFITPLIGSSAGASVGLLYNGGFERVLAGGTFHSTYDMASGWTGNYTLQAYASNGTSGVAVPLPGQLIGGQREYVSLSSDGGGVACAVTQQTRPSSTTACSPRGLSQSSLPLVLGVTFVLSWSDACGAVSGNTSLACSYRVSLDNQFTFVTVTRTSNAWQQQSLSFQSSNLNNQQQGLSVALLSFTQLTGRPLIDSVSLTYAPNTTSRVDLGLTPFAPPSYGEEFYAGNLLALNASQAAVAPFIFGNTAAANDTAVLLPSGLYGRLIHTFPNYSWWGAWSTTAQGNRTYTFSTYVTALNTNIFSIIGMSLRLLSVPGTVTGPGQYGVGYPPVCLPTTSPINCFQVSGPSNNPTRRRLLQMPTVPTLIAGNSVYYSCSLPGQPACNNTLLSITFTPPSELLLGDLLSVNLLVLQLVVYNMDVLFTNFSWTSDGLLYSLPLALASNNTDPISGAVGDPQFTGLRGQRYQVHGVSGSVYNVITDTALQVNARFDFLAAGTRPDPAIINTQGWTHPGTYIGAMSFQVKRTTTLNSSTVDVVVVKAGGHREGFASVSVNGVELTSPHRWQPQGEGEGEGEGEGLVVEYSGSHVVEVQTAQFRFRLVNSDAFINHEVALRVPMRELRCHGLLGQTWRDKVYATPLRYVEGSVDDYAVRLTAEQEEQERGEGVSLLANDFVYNRFGAGDGLRPTVGEGVPFRL